MNAKRFAPAILPLLAFAIACGGGGDAYFERGGAASADASEEAAQAPAPPPMARSAEGVAQGTDQGQASTAPPPGAGQPGADTAAPSMIIRNGTATVRVDSLEPAVERVRRLAQQLGGYVGNTTITTGREEVRVARMELKIPAARFDQALAGIRPVGTLEKVEVTSQDVGEEYVDVSARMTNARRLEERLQNLLATRTGRLEDVLAVERELARVREEIERYEGRLRYLRTRVAVSTLNVELHEPYPTVGDYPGQNPIIRAFSQAWRNFVLFLAALIASLGFLIPLALLGFAAFLVIRWLVRKLDRRRPPPHGGPHHDARRPYQGPPPGSAPPPAPPPPPAGPPGGGG